MAIFLTGSREKSVRKFTDGTARNFTDRVAEEEPLEIRIEHRGRSHVIAVTMRTPGADVDLATGFLFTEGLLPPGQAVGGGAREQANRVSLSWPLAAPPDLRRIERNGYTSSSCGVCGKTSLDLVFQAIPFPQHPGRTSVAIPDLLTLPDRLRQAQQLFAATGGIHAAGLFTPAGQLLHFAEDVGRHNALDKLIGHYYRRDELPLYDRVLLLSGRASFELLQKAAMAGIPFVASVGAPSSLAVELAEDQGITLCGFLCPDGFNCYTHPERVRPS
ncbi:formate dehydrogenase accessory sulfurtransferase FdhD [Lewinella sp. JB7]|uniref:formate dehydrogenase accessory sulfurtransferase FdhD n=1 Tax=Lewinella sp. JB7 TaxID=2962887 RepID=UPI0020C9866A|nr:formate dehydrogenase accessory sulfurtransferase FdhD [Lewinella sp. JB7]MCP9237124.1 formate dehydrogenase accessory sulfurtransferase FdhD [Lewinella sp. JB7]